MLDLWVAKVWRPKRARGEMYIVRYADDFVLGFQSRADAERFLRDLRERLGKFGLRLHPHKTRLIEFGRFAATNRKQKGQGKPETFDFLGFTHVSIHSGEYFGAWEAGPREGQRQGKARIGEGAARRCRVASLAAFRLQPEKVGE